MRAQIRLSGPGWPAERGNVLVGEAGVGAAHLLAVGGCGDVPAFVGRDGWPKQTRKPLGLLLGQLPSYPVHYRESFVDFVRRPTNVA